MSDDALPGLHLARSRAPLPERAGRSDGCAIACCARCCTVPTTASPRNSTPCARSWAPRRSGISPAPCSAPLTLYLTAEPFEYPRSDWPASVRLVGPGVWDPPAERPAWLEESNKPLVLVTCSTEFQNDGKLAQTALDALADEDFDVVVTTAAVDPSEFTPPPNARVAKFLPHGLLLERAACVVCHGAWA